MITDGGDRTAHDAVVEALEDCGIEEGDPTRITHASQASVRDPRSDGRGLHPQVTFETATHLMLTASSLAA